MPSIFSLSLTKDVSDSVILKIENIFDRGSGRTPYMFFLGCKFLTVVVMLVGKCQEKIRKTFREASRKSFYCYFYRSANQKKKIVALCQTPMR